MIERWRLSQADGYTKLPPSTETVDKTSPDTTSKNDEETEESKSQPSMPVDENPTPVQNENENENPTPLQKLPSYSPLAMSNYPPLWSKDSKPKPRPSPRETKSEGNVGTSLSTLNAVLSTTCSREDKKQFNERDPSNRHQYLQQPDRPRTYPRFNYFGAEIGPLGKPPPLFSGGGWGIGKKRK